MFKQITLIAASLLMMACSYQERSSVPTVDGEGLSILLDGMVSDLQSYSSEASDFIYNTPGSVIYWAEGRIKEDGSPDTNGPAQSVFALYNFDFFAPGLMAADLFEVRAAFITNEQTGDHMLILDAGLTVEGEASMGQSFITQYYRQTGSESYTVDSLTQTRKLEVTLENAMTGERIYLVTYDLNEQGFLKPTIQLEVWVDNNGYLEYNGKLTQLSGFE